jgi:hypothetical protein
MFGHPLLLSPVSKLEGEEPNQIRARKSGPLLIFKYSLGTIISSDLNSKRHLKL